MHSPEQTAWASGYAISSSQKKEGSEKAFPDELLRLFRHRSGLTQTELALLVGFKNNRMVTKWEGGFSLPEPRRLQKLIEVYLERGVFVSGQEQAEAQQLWQAVKEQNDTLPDKASPYPIFDTGWFNSLFNQATRPGPVAVPTPTNPAHNLPQALTSFIGRQKELAQLSRQLASTHLLTLTGPGGIGKTRLALEAAALVLNDYPDGVWLVELAPLTGTEQVVGETAGTLGVKETAREPLVTTLKNFLKPKKLLLVLDNCEHLMGVCRELASDLIQSCPGLKILATSRERLAVPGEVLCKVPSLSFPQGEGISVREEEAAWQTEDYEALRLFVERANAVRVDFTLNGQNGQALGELCRRLDGIPLALELAAARTRTLTVAQINRLLDDRFKLLTGGSRVNLPRQQTLKALIDWSYDLLTVEEQVLFRRLAVFVEDFGLEAAEAVCAGEGIEKEGILALLAELVSKSLVKAVRQGTVMRYRLLETIRQYAFEKLAEAGEEALWRESHLHYYLALSGQINVRFELRQLKEKLDLFEREYPNLRGALNWSISRQYGEKALKLCVQLDDFWEGRGLWSEGRTFIENCLALPGADKGSDRSKVLRNLARLAELQGDYQEGIAYASEGLELAQQAGNDPGMADCLSEISNLYFETGNYGTARDFTNRAMYLYRETNHKRGLGGSLRQLGSIAKEQGQYEQARAYLQEALVLFEETGDSPAILVVYNQLGRITLEQSDFEAARHYFSEAVSTAREQGYLGPLAADLSNLGMVAHMQSDFSRAEAYYLEGLAIHRKIGHKRNTANVVLNLGDMSNLSGKYEAARVFTQEALDLSREINYKFGVAVGLRNLGDSAMNLGDYEAAHEYLQESLRLREELGSKYGIGSSLLGLGKLAFLQEEYGQARDYYERSLEIRREIGDKKGQADCLKNLALLAFTLDDFNQGQDLLRRSLEISGELANIILTAETMAVLVYALAKNGSVAAEKAAAPIARRMEALLASKNVVLEQVFLRPYEEALNWLQNKPTHDDFNQAGQPLELYPMLNRALDLIYPGK